MFWISSRYQSCNWHWDLDFLTWLLCILRRWKRMTQCLRSGRTISRRPCALPAAPSAITTSANMRCSHRPCNRAEALAVSGEILNGDRLCVMKGKVFVLDGKSLYRCSVFWPRFPLVYMICFTDSHPVTKEEVDQVRALLEAEVATSSMRTTMMIFTDKRWQRCWPSQATLHTGRHVQKTKNKKFHIFRTVLFCFLLFSASHVHSPCFLFASFPFCPPSSVDREKHVAACVLLWFVKGWFLTTLILTFCGWGWI